MTRHLVELDDEAGLRARRSLEVHVRRGQAARHREAGDVAGCRRRTAVAHQPLGERRRLVAGMEYGRVDRVAIGAHGQRPRRVAEQHDLRESGALERAPEVGRVEHPDVCAPHSLGGELGVVGAVLTPVRGRDERPVAARAREDDVSRLVTHQEGAGHARRVGADIDDAHAVRKVVHHPHLGVAAGGHRHRFQTHRDRGGVGQPPGADGEDLETVIRGVDGEEPRPIRRQGHRSDLPALERRERGRCWRGQEGSEEQQSDGRRGLRHLKLLLGVATCFR